MTCIYDDSYEKGQKKLVEKVHDYPEVKIAAQIAHTGSQVYKPDCESVSPSPLTDPISKRVARELAIKEIYEIIDSFVEAGRRSYECGYDMVQIHAAHGYLLSDFLSPKINKRTDEFGGDTQKRSRILIDIYNQLKDEVSKNFPIIIKLNTIDFLRGGLTLEEGTEIAKNLVDLGYDAIEPTCGRTNLKVSGMKAFPSVIMKTEDDENYFLPNAKALRAYMGNSKLLLMGGIRNPLLAERFLQENIADFISMSRPLVYEPNLPNRWKKGDISPPLCTNCNACLGISLHGPVYCPVKKKLERKSSRESNKKE
jgi:2,4-dienoyl-CoA reductase-like NADH-dependent reductase (Old Yellow Enzyme family)